MSFFTDICKRASVMLKLEYYLNKFKSLPSQGSLEWLEGRQYSFGGSEMATVLDQNPYDNFEELLGHKQSATNNSNDATEWGKLFEPIAKRFVEERWGKIYNFGSIPHCFYPVCYSPDGLLVFEDRLVLLEIKTPIKRGLKKILQPYYLQVQTGLGVIAADYALFAQFRFRRCKWGVNPVNTTYDRIYHLEYRKRQKDMLPIAWGYFYWDEACEFTDLSTLKEMYSTLITFASKPKIYINTYGEEAMDHGAVLMWKCFEDNYASIKREPRFLESKETLLWKKYEELRNFIRLQNHS